MTNEEALNVCFSIHNLVYVDDVELQKYIVNKMVNQINKGCETHIFTLQVDNSCDWFVVAQDVRLENKG